MIRGGGRRYAAVAFAIALLFGGATRLDESPLLEAARRGDVEAVRSLLRDGADPNLAAGDGLTALHVAAEQGFVEVVELLLDAGANATAKTNIGEYEPLHLASRFGHAEVVRVLLEAGAEPAAVATTTGVSPLHLAAKAPNGEEAVRVLLEHGAPVDPRESAAGQTPLMFAASYGRDAAIRELLEHGADPSMRTEVVDAVQSAALDWEAHDRLQQAITEIRRKSPDGTDRLLNPSEVQAAIAVQREFLKSDQEIEAFLRDYSPDDMAMLVPLWVTQGGLESDVRVLLRPEYETLVGKMGGHDRASPCGP